jgi:hypothetical protein
VLQGYSKVGPEMYGKRDAESVCTSYAMGPCQPAAGQLRRAVCDTILAEHSEENVGSSVATQI